MKGLTFKCISDKQYLDNVIDISITLRYKQQDTADYYLYTHTVYVTHVLRVTGDTSMTMHNARLSIK